MKTGFDPDLERDISLVGALVQASSENSCGVAGPSRELVAQLLPILDGKDVRVVATALWAILMAMAEKARERGEAIRLAEEGSPKGPVH